MKKNIRKRRMLIGMLFLFSLLCACGAALREPPPTPGSCTQKCERNATEEGLLPCSCTPSCVVYRDCCLDSGQRTADIGSTAVPKMCLSWSQRGRFLAVSGCPAHWAGSAQFCSESIGHLPPVTSTASGTTYANLYCAVCNGDGERLTTWNVELRCCPEYEGLEGRHYIYRRGHLWSRVDPHRPCPCSYVSHYDDTRFADSLELRPCERSPEISRCSSTWRNDTTRDLCRAFVDSVYIDERVYRNVYCGQCNYERVEHARCMPGIVERKLSEGLDMRSVFEYCANHQLSICLHYFDRLHRGKSYSFSSLLNIREEGCAPPLGKRCCGGYSYDYRTKRCRLIVRSSKRRIHF